MASWLGKIKYLGFDSSICKLGKKHLFSAYI
ncbi:hypothetical protein A8806_116119 [Faecalicatena orotica]|uniref:Uncharacterized protein n=1 Tax=Faecalicatena orotica TaxID=1544 RepID=A0A2Y9BNC2_9FIRM|nr:hypothetical protein A8806_116119 [Faecalicatena orotica]SSA58078.1 hypothetical protein SAMN05216536_116119 [Faecalicatena orotica]